MTRIQFLTIAYFSVLWSTGRVLAAEPAVDLSGYRADSGVTVEHNDGRLRISWELDRESRRESAGTWCWI